MRYVGSSNFRAWQMTRALWLADRRGWNSLQTNWVIYNLLDRGIEGKLAPMCESLGAGILAYSPSMGGYLTGKYRKSGASGRHAKPESSYPRPDQPRSGGIC